MMRKDEIALAATGRLRLSDSIPFWVCPECGAELSKRAALLTCLACGRTWNVIDGVPHFVATFPYWGEIPREHMEAVNRIALTQEWKVALLESQEPSVRRAAEMILNLDRVNWRWLLDLPRRLANWYTRRKGQNGYRNYLYSSRQCRKLLEQAGFRNVRIYLALPSYNHPRFLSPLQKNIVWYYARNFTSGGSHGVRKLIDKVLLKLRLLQYLEYSFIILAQKQGGS